MLLHHILTFLLSIFDQCPVQSLMVFPPKFSKLLCKGTCKWYGGCSRVDHMKNSFQCEVEYGIEMTSRKKGIQLFQVEYKHWVTRWRVEREVYSKHGLPRCLKVKRKLRGASNRPKMLSRTKVKNTGKRARCTLQENGIAPKNFTAACKEGTLKKCTLKCHPQNRTKKKLTSVLGPNTKEEEYVSGPSGIPGKKDQDSEHCIIYKQTNLTYRLENKMLELPIQVLSGMKFTVHGSYIEELPYTQFSITRDKKANLWNMLHTRAQWDDKQLTVIDGFKEFIYKGAFPIPDPTNFSITYALTKSETKIYVNKVLIKSLSLVPSIQDYVIRRYSSVYLILVEKNGEDCRMP